MARVVRQRTVTKKKGIALVKIGKSAMVGRVLKKTGRGITTADARKTAEVEYRRKGIFTTSRESPAAKRKTKECVDASLRMNQPSNRIRRRNLVILKRVLLHRHRRRHTVASRRRWRRRRQRCADGSYWRASVTSNGSRV